MPSHKAQLLVSSVHIALQETAIGCSAAKYAMITDDTTAVEIGGRYIQIKQRTSFLDQ